VTGIPQVRLVMTPFPHSVNSGDPLLRARALMVEYEVRHLPVTENDQLVGVLTDRDLKRALDPDLGLPPKEELFVGDVFVRDAYVVEGSEPLDLVLEHMATHHSGSALVTRDGLLVGILTATDACRLFCDHLRKTLAPGPVGVPA
jgi:acetoin utilization protein AcuB